jgi:DNA-binding LytR/AlgR family response regulator
MPLKCIAIDDEPPALHVIREYAGKFPALQLLHTFDDAITAAEYLRQHPVDLLFIDINMPDITGLDLVRSLAQKPLIIFTTAYKKFAHEGFELDAVDYLLKPISFDRFARAVTKAVEYYEYKNKPKPGGEESLFVYSEYRMIKIGLADIEYIESLEDYIKIHLLNDKPVLTLMTLKGVLEKLPANQFKRIHRSYIVSADRVKSILNRKVTLLSGTELPISDSYVSFINEWKER